MKLAVIVLALAAAPLAAAAQPAPSPACAATDAALPAAYAGWTHPAAITAATRPSEAGRTILKVGRAAKATLSATPGVIYAAAPQKPADATTYGGLLRVDIAAAGDYQAALSAPAWIDVVRDGKPVASGAHAHGPACSSIHKVVDFSLAPGRYILQLSGGPQPAVTIMIVRRP